MSTMFILVIFSHVIIFISINIFSFLIVKNFHGYESAYRRKSTNDSASQVLSFPISLFPSFFSLLFHSVKYLLVGFAKNRLSKKTISIFSCCSRQNDQAFLSIILDTFLQSSIFLHALRFLQIIWRFYVTFTRFSCKSSV